MKEMKKTIILPALLVTGAMLTGCSSREETAPQEGTLQVDLRAETGFNTRAIDENAYANIQNYTVTLKETATGTVVNQAKYSDWALAYKVDSNKEYTLSASYGTEAPASYDELLCYGEQTFTVTPGETYRVTFAAKPQAAKVSVNFSDDFTSYYKDCEVSIKTKHMTAAETMNIEKVGQALYLKAEKNESVELGFRVIKQDGSEATDKSATKTVTVNPQTWLKVTVKPNVTEIQGGKFGINVIVDDGVTEENIDFDVPNNVFK